MPADRARTGASAEEWVPRESWTRPVDLGPLREEEVQVRKPAVVREEVRLKKGRESERRTVSEDLRRVEATIFDRGSVEGPVRGSPPSDDTIKRS